MDGERYGLAQMGHERATRSGGGSAHAADPFTLDTSLLGSSDTQSVREVWNYVCRVMYAEPFRSWLFCSEQNSLPFLPPMAQVEMGVVLDSVSNDANDDVAEEQQQVLAPPSQGADQVPDFLFVPFVFSEAGCMGVYRSKFGLLPLELMMPDLELTQNSFGRFVSLIPHDLCAGHIGVRWVADNVARIMFAGIHSEHRHFTYEFIVRDPLVRCERLFAAVLEHAGPPCDFCYWRGISSCQCPRPLVSRLSRILAQSVVNHERRSWTRFAGMVISSCRKLAQQSFAVQVLDSGWQNAAPKVHVAVTPLATLMGTVDTDTRRHSLRNGFFSPLLDRVGPGMSLLTGAKREEGVPSVSILTSEKYQEKSKSASDPRQPRSLTAEGEVEAFDSVDEDDASSHREWCAAAEQPLEHAVDASHERKSVAIDDTHADVIEGKHFDRLPADAPEVLQAENKRFRCLLCNTRYRRLNHVKVHVRSMHLHHKDAICGNCGRGFSCRGNLNQHMRQVHCNDRPIPCVHCQKSFKVPARLKAHMQRVHPTELSQKETLYR
ncbi:PR domain zinc finger protein 14 [Porphyridium purpureum]|uniref:PR domain zinc finger protein 14 n=1 Tax=Porphyridium purpureum TaxID=35688 RepID=A0A5J4Z500_PORPP|nr:PR domain zinc finger protein 14 [Porphyridium purpureum]|eukprot:POR8532..scf295_1